VERSSEQPGGVGRCGGRQQCCLHFTISATHNELCRSENGGPGSVEMRAASGIVRRQLNHALILAADSMKQEKHSQDDCRNKHFDRRKDGASVGWSK
jgi:hypothetical protein